MKTVAGLSVLLLLGQAFLIAQNPDTVQAPAKLSITDEQVQEIIDQRLGEYYYGLFMGKKKAGYAKTIVRRRLVNSRFNVVQITTVMTWDVKAARTEKTMTITLDTAFFMEAPYSMYMYKASIKDGGLESVYLLTKTLKGYMHSVNKKAAKTETEVPEMNYTLTDFWANELWIPSAAPEKGDRIIYPTLFVTSLRTRNTVSEVAGIDEKQIDGASTFMYRLKYTDADSEMECVLNEDGVAYQVEFSSLITLKLLPKNLAAGPSVPFDYVYDNMVRVRPLPDLSGKVKQLTVSLRAPSEVVFGDAPGQRASFDRDRKIWVITLMPIPDNPVPGTQREREQCLFATDIFPSDHEQVKILTLRAAGTGTAEEKAENLTLYVNKLLKDRVVLQPQSVLETIEKKKGDCTEHSELLVTLMRAAGLPARTVTGLYFDKKIGGYLGHMWAEVLIGNSWIPMDAALKNIPTDCRYIRFPLSEMQMLINSRSLSKMRIEIVK